MRSKNDLAEILSEINLSTPNIFSYLFCDECCLPLEDYGCDPLIFGENDFFVDRFLCYKCAADFLGENDYHSEKSKVSYENDFNAGSSEHIEPIHFRIMQELAHRILKSLSLGMTEKDILKKYSHLKHEDILACFAFAAERI